jgi:carbamoyltransferase
VHEWFEMEPNADSPYMLLVADVQPDKRVPVGEHELGEMTGVDRLLKVVRSKVPAVTHVDYSARVQTVDAERHGRFYRLMKKFKEKTGCPVIINTSFNVRSEPIVCSPEHAYRCFMACNMDVLVLEDFVLDKEEQPKAKQHEIDEYLAQFDLD